MKERVDFKTQRHEPARPIEFCTAALIAFTVDLRERSFELSDWCHWHPRAASHVFVRARSPGATLAVRRRARPAPWRAASSTLAANATARSQDYALDRGDRSGRSIRMGPPDGCSRGKNHATESRRVPTTQAAGRQCSSNVAAEVEAIAGCRPPRRSQELPISASTRLAILGRAGALSPALFYLANPRA